jgi:hypothetical protein
VDGTTLVLVEESECEMKDSDDDGYLDEDLFTITDATLERDGEAGVKLELAGTRVGEVRFDQGDPVNRTEESFEATFEGTLAASE